jgi:anti-sigma B factor antagonist
MPAEVKESDLHADVRVVTLSGRLDLEATEADSPLLQQALEQGPGGIIVDLGDVAFISSSGLRMLIATHQKAQSAGKKMALVRARPSVYKIFKVSALDAMFRFFDSEALAVDALWR